MILARSKYLFIGYIILVISTKKRSQSKVLQITVKADDFGSFLAKFTLNNILGMKYLANFKALIHIFKLTYFVN